MGSTNRTQWVIKNDGGEREEEEAKEGEGETEGERGEHETEWTVLFESLQAVFQERKGVI